MPVRTRSKVSINLYCLFYEYLHFQRFQHDSQVIFTMLRLIKYDHASVSSWHRNFLQSYNLTVLDAPFIPFKCYTASARHTVIV